MARSDSNPIELLVISLLYSHAHWISAYRPKGFLVASAQLNAVKPVRIASYAVARRPFNRSRASLCSRVSDRPPQTYNALNRGCA